MRSGPHHRARGRQLAGRAGLVSVGLSIVLLNGCSDPQASAPVAVEVAPPDKIAAVEVGDVNAQEPFEATPAAGSGPNIKYEFADGLDLPTNDTGYVYRSGQTVDPAVVQRLAEYFGLDSAQVQNWDDLANPQPDQSGDASGVPSAGLGYSPTEALQQWTYADYELSDPYRNCEPVGSDANAPDACTPRPPTGTPPTAQEAEAKLAAMLDETDMAHGPLTFQSYADQYSATTNAVEYDAEGLRTGREWSASYGADGAVITATGSFATPERVGPYELVDLATARQRVESGVNSFGSMGSAGASVDSTPPSAVPTLAADATGDATGDVTSSSVVRIVSVGPDLLWIWDADNNAWLIPAFAFNDADGGVWSVPAVPDDLFAAAQPPATTAG